VNVLKKRAKVHEENIGRRHVTYTFSPNSTVAIDIRSHDTPFKPEIDQDESIIFSLLGQVKDRLLYHVSYMKELHIPSIMQWILKACDLNKDVEIQDNCQMTLSAIQLKYAGRIFRLYVKSLQYKAVYRSEESLTLNRVLLYFFYLCFDLCIFRLTRSLQGKSFSCPFGSSQPELTYFSFPFIV
jgi:hypothetical protein